MSALPTRRALLGAGAAALVLTAASCSTTPVAGPPPGGGMPAAPTVPATTGAVAGARSSATAPTEEVRVDTAPARVVAVALATGNADGVDYRRYLAGGVVDKAAQVVAAGEAVNASRLARFGTVHHAVTLDAFERAERSRANGVVMVTVLTFGWDAPPGPSGPPQAARAAMVPGGAGTRAWYLTLEEGTGLVDGVWSDAEIGDYD